MRQIRKSVLVAVIAASIPAMAQAAETPEHTVTGNLGVFSNYIFRGVTQTSENAALQGGFDYAHKSGAYAGVWGSNVSWLNDSTAYTGSSLELDMYGGYKGTIGKTDFGYDVGGIYYYYPGDKNTALSANTTEVYGALTWQWLTAKLSYALTDYFGTPDSSGTYYADLSASYPVGKSGVTLLAHVGSLKVTGTGNGIYDYTDWKLGASYALPKDFTVGGYYTDTNAPSTSYVYNGKNGAGSNVAVYIQKTF